MAKPKWKLEYIFFGDENSPWRTIFDFERDLADFFLAHGMLAETFPQMEGDPSRKMVWLTKSEELLSEIPSSTQKATEKKIDVGKSLEKVKKAFKGK